MILNEDKLEMVGCITPAAQQWISRKMYFILKIIHRVGQRIKIAVCLDVWWLFWNGVKSFLKEHSENMQPCFHKIFLHFFIYLVSRNVHVRWISQGNAWTGKLEDRMLLYRWFHPILCLKKGKVRLRIKINWLDLPLTFRSQ